MLDKIKQLPKNSYVKQLKDIRVLGFIVFGVLVLLVSYSGANVIQTNYELEQQVAKIQEQNEVQELENNNLRLRNEYFKTDEFLELTARRKFGKASPGEKVLLVPKNVAMNYVAKENIRQKEDKTAEVQKPLYQRNFEAWMSFFLHRSNTDG